MALKIDAASFGERLAKLQAGLRLNDADGSAKWGGATALAVVTGPSVDEIRYVKSIALQLWLFGYELPDTAMVLTPAALHMVASAKKANLVMGVESTAKELGVQIVLHVRRKDEDGGDQLREALAEAKNELGSNLTLGIVAKDKIDGALVKLWSATVESMQVKTVDASLGLADLFAVKDATELAHVRKAAQFTSHVLKQFLLPQIENVIDNEKKVSHQKLAQKTEDVVTDPSKINLKMKPDTVDICYIPMVQSGGTYDLRPSAENAKSNLHYGVIVCSLGTRYKSYCSNAARTYLVDPTVPQQTAYKAMLAAQDAAVAALVDGAMMCAPMQAAVASLEASQVPELAQKITKNIGFGMGLEFRDSSSLLNLKNTGKVRAGMVFNVSVGLQGLENPDSEDELGKKYALYLADTVVVKERGEAEVISDVPKGFQDIAYFFKDENEDKQDEAAKAAKAPAVSAGSSKVVDNKLRSDREYDDDKRRHRDEQQRLVELKNRETLERLTNAKKKEGEGAGMRKTSFTAYQSIDDMPKARELQVVVDKKAEVVLLPIYGQLVPFHIQSVKNVLQSQDGSGNAVIRIQFNVPGSAFGASGYYPAIKFPDATFVQEVSYRSLDGRHATNVVQELKTLRRTVLQRETERAERASLVRQEALVLSKGRVYQLTDLHVKPPLQGGAKGSKITGQLEAHVNGFRYVVSVKMGQNLSIPYKNIKHAFFQPAENARDQCITLIHFTLHDPIMVGKKKTKDVQFFVTVIDAVESLDQNRRSMYDPDEMEEEERERGRRNEINKKFQGFVKRVQELWERDFSELELEFDIPFRELGFCGVPFKSQGFLMPTVNALVELLESPFFVVSLNDVEIVNLERVIFGVKSFDMAIVFKDFNRPVQRIDSIPVAAIDKVKEWLNSVNIKYYESKVNINWAPVQKSILADPEKFVEEGGWEFLNMEKSDSEDEEEEEEAYEPSEAEDEDEEDDDDSSDDDDSDGSVVDSEEDDESGSEDLGSEESEGMSEEELEEWAKRQDKDADLSDDEEKPRKRKGGGPPPGRGRPPPPGTKKQRR